MKRRKFGDGGETTEMEPGSGGYGEAPDMSVEAEKPKTFKEAFAEARSAGDKTFTWNGKKYTTDVAGKPTASKAAVTPTTPPKSAAASTTASKADSSGDQYSGRAQLAKRFGTQEMRDNTKPDIKAEDIEAAKKAGDEKRRRQQETFFDPIKNLAARFGTAGAREKYKAEGYSKGGMTASKRADGIAQRGKTRGTIVACGGGYMKGKK